MSSLSCILHDLYVCSSYLFFRQMRPENSWDTKKNLRRILSSSRVIGYKLKKTQLDCTRRKKDVFRYVCVAKRAECWVEPEINWHVHVDEKWRRCHHHKFKWKSDDSSSIIPIPIIFITNNAGPHCKESNNRTTLWEMCEGLTGTRRRTEAATAGQRRGTCTVDLTQSHCTRRKRTSATAATITVFSYRKYKNWRNLRWSSIRTSSPHDPSEFTSTIQFHHERSTNSNTARTTERNRIIIIFFFHNNDCSPILIVHKNSSASSGLGNIGQGSFWPNGNSTAAAVASFPSSTYDWTQMSQVQWSRTRKSSESISHGTSGMYLFWYIGYFHLIVCM